MEPNFTEVDEFPLSTVGLRSPVQMRSHILVVLSPGASFRPDHQLNINSQKNMVLSEIVETFSPGHLQNTFCHWQKDFFHGRRKMWHLHTF